MREGSTYVVHDLTVPQKAAVEPDANVWLSASAGSGKTQVLSARVIRLLLAGARPEEILCLTFTKAAAAEMAERINRKLASWVQLKDAYLSRELEAIGADHAKTVLPAARKLFAQILDAPGGGLQIMTIHSFCQSLLGSFPEEAGIMPGFEPLDDRTKVELQKEALAQIAHAVDETGDVRIAESLHRLGLEHGEDNAWAFLQRCAGAVETLRHLPEDKGALPFVRRHLGLNFEGSTDDVMASLCGDDAIDLLSIKSVQDMNIDWGSDRGTVRGGKIAQWLAMSPMQRGQSVALLQACWAKSDGEPMIATKGHTPPNDRYANIALDLYQWTKKLCEMRAVADYADRLADALLAGKAFALRYAALKRSRGLVDFDDLIAKAAELLTTRHMAEWVRYKLDRRIDHILVDEAQDTNDKQWAIIKALSDDFFAGESYKDEKARTVFAVGDFKQAIYGFQGTDPAKYRAAGDWYAERLAAQDHQLQQLTLSRSFRSTQPIIKLVNSLIETLGAERFGLDEPVEDHFSERPDIGSVELIEPVTAASAVEDGDGDGDEEKWLGPEKRELAAMLAQKIKALVDDRPVLATTGKPLNPGDIMVLFRKRTEVAALLVARLHALKVPVTGIDRLQLDDQLAVQDLIAAIRFAVQPQDDLSLACLLVSPLIGWSQDQLLDYGYRHDNASLWQHLRRNAALTADLEPLRAMLASADFTTPYEFLEQILSGHTQGRKKFAARLGEEVLVPLEEFLNLAIEFEQAKGGTLQQFLDWFERSSSEIKRERLTGSDEVQIMTVHGAKGLQAPVVILADVTVDPGTRGNRDPNAVLPLDEGNLPMLRVNKEARFAKLAELEDAREATELNEHYRLLYVALTRAEERLIMAGSLGSRQKEPKPDSWHCAIETAMDALGCTQISDIKGRVVRLLTGERPSAGREVSAADQVVTATTALPDWLLQAASPEARPPRPLAPSQLDDRELGERPAASAMRHAAERGKLIHGLIERLDGSGLDGFDQQAARWLSARDRERRHDHGAIIAQVRGLVADPRWQDLFSRAARAEVPIAAVVGDTVVSGRIDRLLVQSDRVLIVDFKTARKVPENPAQVIIPELRQMAHYVAAVERIFPDHAVSAALLYTYGPVMVELSESDLAQHRPV